MMILSVIAILIVLALAGYAAWLLWRLHRQRQFQQRQKEEYLRQKREHEDYLIRSIHLIAHSLKQGELVLSEGVIRLRALLDMLGLPDDKRSDFQALDELYDAVQHFDTHQARRALPASERARQDREREALEDRRREIVMPVVHRLADEKFEGFGSGNTK